ncbi:hypothetical protein SEPCBS119000_001641 [Sporothrix epigloea]|uniref:Mitochondrial outer membrane protein OM14 C-terminal domain-containing protein n=1 Tax=Sporothrix epigloea TaxID=1892477 RepID=A0ABP0DBT6_9PEZI
MDSRLTGPVTAAAGLYQRLSYADIAAKGPKQTPEQAAAPQLPEIENTESIASTTSLPDVDSPDIQTIASEDAESVINALDKDESEQIARDASKQKAKASGSAKNAKEKAKKAAGKAKDKASAKAHEAEESAKRADRWLTSQFSTFEEDHPRAAQAVVVSNLLAVVGLGAFLGYRAWGLHEQGRLGWKSTAAGLAVLGAVGLAEGTFASYFYKGKKKE